MHGRAHLIAYPRVRFIDARALAWGGVRVSRLEDRALNTVGLSGPAEAFFWGPPEASGGRRRREGEEEGGRDGGGEGGKGV